MLRIHKGDLVKVVSGGLKGTVAKVSAINPKQQTVTLEGQKKVSRHYRPTNVNPKGSTKEIQLPIHISNVALVTDGKTATSKVGYSQSKDGAKVRTARANGNKEIK